MINSDRGDEYVIETILNGIALAEKMGATMADPRRGGCFSLPQFGPLSNGIKIHSMPDLKTWPLREG